MSGGYVPLFASLTSGTLCGRWPDVGLWPIVLSLSDRHGIVDVTPVYLASVTGLPLLDLVACMRRFCEPDPYSRTDAESGARLVLIDEHRDWGWKIVNHGLYREKARKQMRQIDATASGRDAERKRLERGRNTSSEVRRSPASPAESSADRPSDSDSDSDSDINTKTQKAAARRSSIQAPAFHAEVVAAYHQICHDLPGVKIWTDQRRASLDARIVERKSAGKPADTVEYWRSVFEKIAASDFLCGRAGKFRADLAWLLKPENFAKTIEGRYDGSRPTNGAHANE